jgi:hypothetical protein
MGGYDLVTLRRPLAELERWVAEMKFWFEPQILPLPVITIQSGPQNALGWFAWSTWETRDGAILNEINFVPEHMFRDVFDIAETMVHELVHLANYAEGIKDCSSNQYHNRNFRDRALTVDLTCERIGARGWAKTGLTPKLRARIAALQPDSSAFDLFRLPPAPVQTTTDSGQVPVGVTNGDDRQGKGRMQTTKKKLAKWTCGWRCASAWVATGTDFRVACLNCGSEFSRVESP